MRRLKRQVRELADDCCEYCLSQGSIATQPFAVEHIIPVCRGGPTILENLALACPGCNSHKYNKVAGVDPLDGNSVPLFHPRRQKWEEHFRWSDDKTEIVGISATGRATVATLKLNRSQLVRLRKILLLTNNHPPRRRTDS